MSARYTVAAVGLVGGVLGLALMLGVAALAIPAYVWLLGVAPWPLLVAGWLIPALALKRWEEGSRR